MAKYTIYLAVLALVLVCEAKPREEKKEVKPECYDNKYEVTDPETGCYYGHREVKTDDGRTVGQYQVVLPDNRLQIVKYCVSKEGGYTANVEYRPAPKCLVQPKEKPKKDENKASDDEEDKVNDDDEPTE